MVDMVFSGSGTQGDPYVILHDPPQPPPEWVDEAKRRVAAVATQFPVLDVLPEVDQLAPGDVLLPSLVPPGVQVDEPNAPRGTWYEHETRIGQVLGLDLLPDGQAGEVYARMLWAGDDRDRYQSRYFAGGVVRMPDVDPAMLLADVTEAWCNVGGVEP